MFCFKLGKRATETYEMLKLAFRDGTMSRTWALWLPFKFWKAGHVECSGHPSTSKTYRDVVQELDHENTCFTICMLANVLGISFGTWKSIFDTRYEHIMECHKMLLLTLLWLHRNLWPTKAWLLSHTLPVPRSSTLRAMTRGLHGIAGKSCYHSEKKIISRNFLITPGTFPKELWVVPFYRQKRDLVPTVTRNKVCDTSCESSIQRSVLTRMVHHTYIHTYITYIQNSVY
jgi:hypothetical protein